METRLRQCINYFGSFEEREEAFRQSVSFLIPRRHMGARLFWEDFGRISREGFKARENLPVSYITCNPRDCLAFGSARQVLNAASKSAGQGGSDPADFTERVAAEFGIEENIEQPIRTLSGGETVKLALAKTYIVSHRSSRVSIASPFSWLSSENAIFFQRLMDRLFECRIPISIFALSGEDSVKAIGPEDPFSVNASDDIGFSLELKDVRIPLSFSVNPMQSVAPFAAVEDFQAAMTSPCLVSGNNGQGKSLVAKILAGAVRFRGTARMIRNEKNATARLLFQDVGIQTMLRSFSSLSASGRGNGRARVVLGLFEEICKACVKAFGGRSEGVPLIRSVVGDRDPSLLEIKAILVAARLAERSSALILDEPDWGLTREAAVAFVASVIETAHRDGVPVLLISHKPWWTPVAKSHLTVLRSPNTDREDLPTFSIRLDAGKGRP